MSDEIRVEGAQTETNTQAVPGTAPQSAALDDIKKLIADAVTENNRTWQSRFDRLREEKVQTEQKAMTVEERMAQFEKERQSERTQWARKEAKARAGIDDVFEQAALAYASDDPEQIGQAANQLKAFFEQREAQYVAKIAELEKKLQYGAKAPVGSQGSGVTDFSQMSLDEVTRYAQQSPAHLSEVMSWRKSQKR